MNSYERIITVLEGKIPDVLPVAPFLSNHAAKIAGVPLSSYYCDGKLMGRVLYEAWERYGYDMIFAQSDNYYIAEGMGLETRKEGELLPCITNHPVSSFAEAARTLKVPDPYSDGRMPVYLDALDYLNARVGKKVALRGTGTGMFSLLSHLYGLENFLMDVGEMAMGVEEEDPDALEDAKMFHEAMEICTETLVRFSTAEIEAGANVVHMGDSLGSLNVISPSIFRGYVWPYLREYFERMQPVFKKYHAFGLLHICGDNSRVLEDYVATGADLYEMDYKMDVAKTKQQVDGRMTLLGNVNPAELVQASAEQIRETCRKIVRDGAAGGKFILGTGCETGTITPPENIHAMVEVAHSYHYEG
ncbi:MAG: uroporphyrinogen decarboxylase family protein [Lachnospiraceae bacterium]|nr:uroporphyrinogen decarboxylase family protein [Lachnospiraceae bacterium]